MRSGGNFERQTVSSDLRSIYQDRTKYQIRKKYESLPSNDASKARTIYSIVGEINSVGIRS